MRFIDAYKRLEKLCGELLGDERRISAYIDEMAKSPRGCFLVRGWEDDLKRLKHYRWCRNRIVHEPDCTEEELCAEADAQWLIDFYSRILERTDPLALYSQATQPRKEIGVRERKTKDAERIPRRKAFVLIAFFAVAVAIVIAVAVQAACSMVG